MRQMCTTAALAVAATAGMAFGQLNDLLTNASFEMNWAEAGRGGSRPGGVFGLSDNGDTGSSAVLTFGHTGTRCIQIGSLIPGDFTGYTTDTTDEFSPNYTFLFFDLPISWQMGDIVASIWYRIDADQSLGNPGTENWPVDAPLPFAWPAGFGPASLKLEVKGAGNGNQNNGANDGWSYGFARSPKARDLLIWGDTNGQWRQRIITWPARATDGSGWKDQTEANSVPRPNDTPAYIGYPLPPEGTWPNPPYADPGQPMAARFPDRCKITIGRWNPVSAANGGVNAGGTIYFDDIAFSQLPEGGGTQPCNDADLGSAGGVPGADGLLDNNDFIAFITHFFSQDAEADMGIAGGVRGSDSLWDNNDFIAFITVFFQPCD